MLLSPRAVVVVVVLLWAFWFCFVCSLVPRAPCCLWWLCGCVTRLWGTMQLVSMHARLQQEQQARQAALHRADALEVRVWPEIDAPAAIASHNPLVLRLICLLLSVDSS